MTHSILKADDLLLRLLRDTQEDYALLSRWLSDERVLEFYEGRDNPFDLAKARAKFAPYAQGRDRVVSCILEHAGRPLGYVQFYPLVQDEAHQYGLAAIDRVYGVDLFIGEPALWNRGLGTKALSALTHYLFQVRNAKSVVIDPQVTNARAIRSYEKCGFRRVKVLPKHEMHEGELRDCLLMIKDVP